ncbi:MAG: HAMP domain-containing histidine kinase, partial [Clostridiaceae bacterium]|nr:HAMP domain-containing histidine kinase [Clostridiaceae bacterium]
NALQTRLNVSNSHDELKDLAQTINKMLDGIETSYEQQNQFVSDASHELRTPIAVIQGYANMLSRWGKDDKEVLDESITAIKDEACDMQQLVEKLLFLARSDKNTQKIEKIYFNINELIDEIIKETKLIDCDHEIRTDINEHSPIYADKKLLKQALRVFVDNSIKYTKSGGIIVLNSYIKKKDLIIDIIDTGIGIPSEDLPFIFNRFYRCDKSRTKDSGGTGLGLTIAKWIIGKHNGSIVVESRPEIGTTIRIGLPLKTNYN